jgi:hypothetical protein
MNTDENSDDYEFAIEVDLEALPYVLKYIQELINLKRLEKEHDAVTRQLDELEVQKLITEVNEDLWKYEQE